MKSKLPNGNVERCGNCMKEMTINECTVHSKVTEPCYYCHLQHEHVSEWGDDSVDKKELPLNPSEGGQI